MLKSYDSNQCFSDISFASFHSKLMKIYASINQTLNWSLSRKHENEDYTVKNVLNDLTNINEFL